jgi:hypothetical protein
MTAVRLLTVAVLVLAGLRASALSRPEYELIAKSIRAGQLDTVDKATGGLDKLPLLTLDLTLELGARHVSGSARLDWRNTTGTPVSELPIRLSANGESKRGPQVKWTQLRATMPNGEAAPATSKRVSTTIMMVTLPRPLAPNERVILDGHLDGKMPKLAAGSSDPMQASMSAFSSTKKADGEQYGTFACGDGICTLTGFTPEVPTFMDGAFDIAEGSGIGDATFSEPQNMLLGIVVDKRVVLAVSGLEVGRVPQGDKLRLSYAMAAAREIGIVASDHFKVQTKELDGVRVRSIALDADDKSSTAVLNAAYESLSTFDQAFGPYPWAFLDVAESSLVGGAGGVELPGLALDGAGFYRPAGGMLAMMDGDNQLFAIVLDFITRHEVAHQWWHAQVGSHAQLHPYIDEPLAQWSAMYSVRVSQGQAAADRVRTSQVAVNFQALSMLGIPDGKVARPASAFASPLEYAGIVYGKAPLFYEDAAKTFGEAKILAGLRYLVEQKSLRRATPDDVWAALVHGTGQKEAALMQRLWRHWFEELHGEEDLGPLDLAGVASAMQLPGLSGGLPGGASSIDPATLHQVMKQLQEMMKGMNQDDDSQ